MRPPSPVRRGLVLVIAAAAVVAGAGPAAADPAPVAASPVTLVAQVADGTSLAGTADRADTGEADVTHVLAPLRRIAVEVPAADVREQAERLDDLPGVVAVTQAKRRYVSAAPNDPYYANQQAYLSAIDLPAAWDVTHGSSAVKIGVVDTGVDVTHPDLAGKIVATYNAVTGTSTVTDNVGHGTFVSGVAAADTDNAVGVAGAGYDTSLVVAKVDKVDPFAEDDYSITTADEARGIVWAADQGVKIINISLGSAGSDATERAAVEYAQRKGVLVVAAAGNESSSTPNYPAAYPGVVGVAATNSLGTKASFSNYGSWVSVAAPGTMIRSTAPQAGSTFFAAGYDTSQGTSFSSPLVAGVAGLLAAQYPNATAADLRNALVATAHSAGTGLGTGVVDADAALDYLVLNAVTGAGTTFYPVRDGYRDTFTPTVHLERPSTLTLQVLDAAGATVKTLTAARGAGTTGFTWDGTNSAGALVAAGGYSYRYLATDASGARSTTPSYGVTVSGKRLVTRTATLVRNGSAGRATRDARCERTARSALRGGKRLVNSCTGRRTRTVAATYSFTVPSAVSYTRLSSAVRARSASHPARLVGRLARTSGGVTTTTARTIRSARTHTYSLGGATATGRVTAARTVRVGVALTNRYTRRGHASDLDIGRVTLRVTYRVLV